MTTKLHYKIENMLTKKDNITNKWKPHKKHKVLHTKNNKVFKTATYIHSKSMQLLAMTTVITA